MKARMFLFATLAGLSALADGFDPTAYARHLAVSVAQGKIADGNRFANVPVLLRLGPSSIPGFDYADFMEPDHADLAVTDSEGNLLPFEVAKWNDGGESCLWVVPPSPSGMTAASPASGSCRRSFRRTLCFTYTTAEARFRSRPQPHGPAISAFGISIRRGSPAA